MTTQYAVLKGLPNGLALDAGKLFSVADPDTVVTGNTFGFSNRTNANTQYVVSIVRGTALPVGDYTFIAYIGSSPKAEIALTFLGTDGETATETARLAVLDSTVLTQLDDIEADAAASVGYLTTLVARLTANAATAIQNLYHMITGTGASSKYTFAALENAPSGGGGGDAEQDTLLEVQTTVNALALSLAGSSVTVTSRVSGSEITAYIGDDYKVRSGTELEITVSDTGGALHTKLAAIGTSNLYFGASLPRKDPGQITGTISSLSYATNVLTIAVEITACASGLTTGDYTYQIQSSQAQSGSYDDYIELEGTFVVKQRTVAVRG